MANTDSPFDVRIVNPLERPRSEDFNLAQSAQRTTAQTLAGAVFPLGRRFNEPTQRQLAFSELSFFPEPLDTPGLGIKLRRGFGLAYSGYEQGWTNVGGIPGVDLSNATSYVPLVLSDDKIITVPTPPPAGKCRRDFVAIKRMTAQTVTLTDQQATNVFNASNQVFEPALKYKTLGFDYIDTPVFITPPGGGAYPELAYSLIYIPGIEYDYEDESTFYALATTERSTIPNLYTLIAAINVPPNATEITADLICDFRPILFAQNAHTVPIRFRCGASDASPPVPGAVLTFDPFDTRVPGIPTVSMVKIGGDSANLYSVVIPGLWRLNAATGIAALAQESPGPVTTKGFEIVVVNNYEVTRASFDNLATAEQKAALADPTLTMPPQTVAVGQPLTQVKFGIGCLNWDYHRVDYSATVFGTTDFGDPIRALYVSGSITLAY